MPSNRKQTKTLGGCRLVQVFGEIDADVASKVIDNLIKLDSENDKDIILLIDSPGGDADGCISICLVMQLLKCDVATLALGSAASAAAIYLQLVLLVKEW